MLDTNKTIVTILTASDFPDGRAPENFVREMVKGIATITGEDKIQVIRFWGNRNGCNNNTGIECVNYLFRKPFTNELAKFFESFLQMINVPLFLIKIKFIKKSNVLILYGIDRAYIIIPMMFFCKIFRIKCFRIITEIYRAEDYAYYWWRKPLVYFYNLQLRYFDRYMDGIIVLSKYLQNLCVNNGVKEKNILLIPHFIDFRKRTKLHKISIIDNSVFNIVYSGTITSENGVKDLVDAFILSKTKYSLSAALTIMGKKNSNLFTESDEKELRKYNIIFTGSLEREDIFTVMYNSDLLVNPRRKSILADSGFPTKIGEYFSTKIPVLSTSVGDLPTYFNHKRELFFSPPDNPEAMSDMIYYIYLHKEERLLVGERGYLWGKENLDSLKNAQKLFQFINQYT